jgi:hypothetical protein
VENVIRDIRYRITSCLDGTKHSLSDSTYIASTNHALQNNLILKNMSKYLV